MEEKIGTGTHYYGNVGVASVKVSRPLNTGDTLHFVGRSDDFTEKVESIQIEHKQVESAKKGDEVGVKVGQKVHEGDEVFLVKE